MNFKNAKLDYSDPYIFMNDTKTIGSYAFWKRKYPSLPDYQLLKLEFLSRKDTTLSIDDIKNEKKRYDTQLIAEYNRNIIEEYDRNINENEN